MRRAFVGNWLPMSRLVQRRLLARRSHALPGNDLSNAVEIQELSNWQHLTEWWHSQLQRAAGFVRQQSGDCVECNAMCAHLCCAVAWVTCVVWGNVLSGVPCMTGCGALRAPRNLHATHTTMSVRGTRQPPFPACDACYELKQTELPGLPWSLASGDYAYYFQDAVPSRFLA